MMIGLAKSNATTRERDITMVIDSTDCNGKSSLDLANSLSSIRFPFFAMFHKMKEEINRGEEQ